MNSPPQSIADEADEADEVDKARHVPFLFNGSPLLLLSERDICAMCKIAPNSIETSSTDRWKSRKACCGRMICANCELQHLSKHLFQHTAPPACPLCRALPVLTPIETFERLKLWAHIHCDPCSQVHVGDCYLYGTGVDLDYARALLWYDRASVHQHPDAYFKLGIMYHYGFGCRRNYTRAASYYKKAMQGGVAEAVIGLKELERKSVARKNRKAGHTSR